MSRRVNGKSVASATLGFALLLATAGAWQLGWLPWSPRQPHVALPAVVPATVPAATAPAALPAGTIGAVDLPVAEATVGTTMRLTGWALDPAGVRGIEIRVAGQRHDARFGLPRPDVGEVKPGYPDSPASGFAFEGEFAALAAARHVVEVVAVSRAGGETVLGRKSLLSPAALAEWQPLYDARRGAEAPAFFVLPGTSGVAVGGASELDAVYAAYLSPTFKVGMRVPILYLRTTTGAAHDWTFDPAWNIDRRCGERRIADDSLDSVIAHAVRHRLPVLFTLNGGIWSDSSCGVPEWDLTDHLEQDKANCQWNDRDEVMPDDALQHLPGSATSPELARSLTFNVYAAENRRYKRRNLQQAGRVIAAFAREHPDLFVGVNLDPDTYFNPFFDERQWYDYNPGTLRQFREWLAGSGPYAGKPDAGVPDLSHYRRTRPLTLAGVGALAGTRYRSWQDVQPPRAFPREGKPYWESAWTHEWEKFRRHAVDLHYDELSQWLAEAGIAPARIYSSQGFLAPAAGAMPFAVKLDSPTKNHDSGGMSVEGSIPRAGHLGAIVYGDGAVNATRMEGGANQFATFRRMDLGWGVVEFNTADFRHPQDLPTYAMGYRALREMFNYGARFASPMAWNGSNGIYAGQPGYASYTAWRNTPLEEAMRDFAVSHRFVPLGSRLWTFGSPRHGDDDGWTTPGGQLTPGPGHLDIAPSREAIRLVSPPALALAPGDTDLLVLGIDAEVGSITVEALAPGDAWVTLAPPRAARELAATSAGLSVPLAWPAGLEHTDQVRISLSLLDPTRPARVRHIALYRAPDGPQAR